MGLAAMCKGHPASDFQEMPGEVAGRRIFSFVTPQRSLWNRQTRERRTPPCHFTGSSGAERCLGAPRPRRPAGSSPAAGLAAVRALGAERPRGANPRRWPSLPGAKHPWSAPRGGGHPAAGGTDRALISPAGAQPSRPAVYLPGPLF